MLLHPANFLLLDEPTNHLDMRAKDVLLTALSKYTGTVVFVSHDRYFIDKLASRVFEIGNGRVEVYPGNYEDFMWRKQGGAEKLQEQISSSRQSESGNGNGATAAQSRLPADGDKPAKRLNPIKRKKLEDRVQELEEQISQLEGAIASAETSLQTFVSAEETARVSRELDQHRADLQARVAEWEQIGQELGVSS
jgi:ATP-binding cassette subfamily F protein 3